MAKKIEAAINSLKLEELRNALDKVGYPGMMITHIEGHGRQKGFIEETPGNFKADLRPKIKVEIVVNDKDVKKIVDTIAETVRTGKVGDGKIFVTNIEEVVRIRTGEKGEKAV